MNMPGFSTSAETLLKVYGTYHLTRLQADKNVKELAEGFEKAQMRLKEKLSAFESASLTAMRALAVRDGEDAVLDETIRKFYNTVMAKCGNNRKSPLFRRYFPEGLFPLVSAPLEGEIMKVEAILTKLLEEEEADLKNFKSSLESSKKNLKVAMDAHSSALETESSAFGMVQAEKIKWLDVYKLDYRALGHLYYQNPKKAETYFKPAPKEKAKKEEPQAPPKV